MHIFYAYIRHVIHICILIAKMVYAQLFQLPPL